MTWLKIAWGFLSGNLGTIANAVAGAVGKLSDNETARFNTAVGAERDVKIATIQASATAYHERAEMLRGMRVTQWLITAALIPPLLHQGAIYLDSTFCNDALHQCTIVGDWLGMPWRVPKAPPPYDEREWALIGSLLGVNGAIGLGGSFLRWLHLK